MSGVDSEQDKQPISSVNGQTGDNGTEDHAPTAEGSKGTAETETTAAVSCQNEATDLEKNGDAKNGTTVSQSPEIITNGESGKGHENGEVSEKAEESSVLENKTDEPPDENQVDEAEKEVEKAAEESVPQESNGPAATTTDGEQREAEAALVLVEKTDKEREEGAQVDDKQTEEQCENQPSEDSKDSVTDIEPVDRKRAVTIDNPVDMNELTAKSGESPQKAEGTSLQERSRTLGDIEGSASSSLKEDVAARSRTIWYTDEVEDAQSKPDSTATEEMTVSYSTSIVGGVVHRVPINSSSPKTQHKPKEGSPQSSPSKTRAVIHSLFGRHKKSKGGPESPPENAEDAEKESPQKVPESSPVTPSNDEDAAKGDTGASESGLSAEVEDTKGTDAEQGAEVTAAVEKEGEDGEMKPAAVVQSEEDIKEEKTEAAKESKVEEGEGKSQDVQVVPVPVEGAEEKGETSVESPKGEQSEETKDAVKRGHSDLPEEEETSPQPAAKKKKPIFGGIFTRRKSKKSKGDGAAPSTETPQGKEGHEEQQGEGLSTETADDAKPQTVEGEAALKDGTDQDMSPNTAGTAAAAQQEVTEDAISPSVDQAVESAKEEIADKEEQEGETAEGGEPSGKEEKTVVPEDVQKSADVEKEETEEKPIQPQDSQPEKKQSIFSGFFGRRKSKKSKDEDAPPRTETPQEKEGDKVEEQGESMSAQPADDAKLQVVEGVETSENGADQRASPDTSDTTAAAQQEVAEDVISPAVDQAVESAKAEIEDKEKVDGNVGEQEGEGAIEGGQSKREEESLVPGDVQNSAEETPQSKDADGTVEKGETEEKAVQSQDSQPEKKHSIFSGFFGRRKSKKSKDEDATPPTETPQEKEGDKVEEQGESMSAKPADDAKLQAVGRVQTSKSEADQGASPDTSDTTTAAKQEVAEDAIRPAVDQAVENAKEEITDKENVDGNIGEQETIPAPEPSDKQVETAVPEDVMKSTEEKSEINDKPRIEEPSEDTSKATSALSKPVLENASSPESQEAQDEDTALRERIALSQQTSHSPKTRRMQMRISYAEADGEGGREVEVIGTPERGPQTPNQKGKTPPDHRVSCRSLGEADHEGWLAKKGGPLFFSSWKRKWVVLKEGKLYYFKTVFDPEASGVINMEGVTVAQAPETKKNFCFKCEQPGPKPQVLVFMADSKEDMEKWLTVLAAASRGETIQKTKQHHLAPRDEVVMRRKSGSGPSAQRTSSVLAVGGRHDFLEDEEDLKVARRRSTPGSLSKPHKETEEEDKQTSVSSDTHPVISDTQEVSKPPQDNQEETKSGEGEIAEKPVSVVDEVLESSEQVVVESVSPVEVSPSEQETPAVESSPGAVISEEEEKGSEQHADVSLEVTAATESAHPEQASAPDATDSAVDKTDGAVSVVTTESSVTVVETVKTTSVISEKVETVVSVVKTEVTAVSSVQQPSEADELKQDVKEDFKETSPTQPDASAPLPGEPASPSKTKWYFTLDRQETWSVPPEVEGDKSSSRPKSPGSSSDKGSIESDRGSIKSDKGSIKSSSDDDLLIMCRNIREARLSIVGDPMWEGAERLRALSSVHDDNEEAFVKLKTLERTLKDKEKHLSELEELLSQPEINRDSIYAWKSRYSDLVEEFFPQDDGDEQEKSENAAEGGEGETQASEKEVKEETPEEVKKKSDDALATSSKKDDEGNVDEEPSSEKQKEETKENENDNLTVIVQIQQSPVESVPVKDSEKYVQEIETAQEGEISAEPSGEQKPSDTEEGSGEQEDSEDTLDTYL